MPKVQRPRLVEFTHLTDQRLGLPTSVAKRRLDRLRAHLPKNKANVSTWHTNGKKNSPAITSSGRVDAAHVLSDLGIRRILGIAVLKARDNPTLRPKIAQDVGQLVSALMGPENDAKQSLMVSEGLTAVQSLMSAETQHLSKSKALVSVLTRGAMNNLRPGIGLENSSIQEHFDPNIDSSGMLTPRTKAIAQKTAAIAKTLNLSTSESFLTTRSGVFVGDLPNASAIASFSDSSGGM